MHNSWGFKSPLGHSLSSVSSAVLPGDSAAASCPCVRMRNLPNVDRRIHMAKTCRQNSEPDRDLPRVRSRHPRASRPPPTFPSSPRSSARTAPSRRSTSAWASTDDGYNIFAVGPTGHRQDQHRLRLPDEAGGLPARPPTTGSTSTTSPSPTSPMPSACRPGKAQEFRKDMEKLVEDLQAAITQAFEGEEYEKQRREHRPAGRRAAGGQARAL